MTYTLFHYKLTLIISFFSFFDVMDIKIHPSLKLENNSQQTVLNEMLTLSSHKRETSVHRSYRGSPFQDHCHNGQKKKEKVLIPLMLLKLSIC